MEAVRHAGGKVRIKIMNWDKFTEECHGIAKASGWHEETVSEATVLANIHGEISEAWEAYRKDLTSPHGNAVVVEMGDVVIRICDWFGSKNLPLSPFLGKAVGPTDFAGFVAELHSYVTGTGERALAHNFGTVVSMIDARYGEELYEAMRRKCEYNKTRPYRHGGLKA